MHYLLSLFLLLLVGCVPPPEAPAEVNDLVSWLYSHHRDEDPAAMAAGIDRLDEWLEGHLEEVLEEDWQVTPLSEETVDAVDAVNRTTEDMVALAVFTESNHNLDDAAYAMIGAEIDAVFPDGYSEYLREWGSDPDCFLSKECERAEAYENYTASFPFNLYTTSELQNEYMWVQGSRRRAMVQRNWLLTPPETNSPLLEVDEMFHLNLFIESDRGFVRLQSAWMIVTQDAVNATTAIRMVGDNYRDGSETLDEWLDGQQR
ncbi:MAG: hypothetical protein CMP23_08910 [Rickettsiales bacterium]|nr:hypothetical protein [Rickettsiales bacterium]|tara:strand:- start:658 stop:1437 length:780 start_codon:yes stop_codon:yes gene_type:complete